MSRCICGHQWDDHATWCYSSGCPCHFKRAPEVSVAALLAELKAGVEGLPQGKRTRRPTYLDDEGNRRTDYSQPLGVYADGRIARRAVLDLIRKAGKP